MFVESLAENFVSMIDVHDRLQYIFNVLDSLLESLSIASKLLPVVALSAGAMSVFPDTHYVHLRCHVESNLKQTDD